MTLRHIGALVLGSFLLLCGVFVTLVLWEDRAIRRSVESISLLHNEHYIAAQRAGDDLRSVELAYEIFRRSDVVRPETVTSLVTNNVSEILVWLADGVTQTGLAAERERMQKLQDSVRNIQIAWFEALDSFSLEGDLSSDTFNHQIDYLIGSLGHARRMLSDLYKRIPQLSALISHKQQHSLQTHIHEYRQSLNQLEAEILEFLAQEQISADDMLVPAQNLLSRLTEGRLAGDESTQVEALRTQTLALVHALDDLHLAEESGDESLIEYTLMLIGTNISQLQLQMREQSLRAEGEAVSAVNTMNEKLDTFLVARQSAVLIGALVLMGAAMLVVLLVRSRSAELCDGTRRLSEGNWHVRLPARGGDSFGQIFKSFNTMAEQLELREQERNAFIEALDESMQKAEAANIAKGEFLASMSHEIRTPINGVLGAADLLRQEPLEQSQRHLVHTIVRSSRSLLGIINDILDFSKIEAGKLELDPVQTDPYQLVEDVVELAAPSAQEKGLEINSILSPAVPINVYLDALRLRQILTNLIGNAIKFTEHGEVVVKVDFVGEGDAQRLQFEVSDTGIGISPRALENIFSAFTQAERSTTRRFGGSGLGLAISHRLVEMMSGEITVFSEIGRGSRFVLTLPVGASSDNIDDLKLTARDRVAQLARPVRLLLIASSPSMQSSMRNLFRSMHIESEICTTGERGLERIAQTSPPAEEAAEKIVVMVDNILSDMSGVDFLRRLQQQTTDSLSARVVLCLFGEASRMFQTYRELGVTHTLTKPVRQSALYNTLLEITGDADRRQSLQQTPAEQRPLAGSVLLVEDHPTNQDIITRMLKRLGCETTLAENGRVALEKMQQWRFDVVLMDFDMPVMDGLEATRKWRWQEQQQRVSDPQPIIALTANALRGDKEKGLEAGMNDFISKPVDLDQLRKALEPWMSSRQVRSGTDAETAQTRQIVSDDSTNEPALADNPGELLDAMAVEQLFELAEGAESGFLEALFEQFEVSFSQDLESLISASCEQNVEACRKLAHKLKSGCRTLGARRLADRCQELESAAADGELPDPGELQIALPALFEETLSACFKLIENRAA